MEYGLGNKIIVNDEKNNYECYETAEQDVFQESNIINQKLDWSRKILSDMHFSTGKNPVEYKVCCYESKEINAFSAKITSNSYMIALSTELLIGMVAELEAYFMHLDLRRYFWGQKKTAKKHVQKVYEYILLYVVLHEYYHILNGHCDSAYAKRKIMAERAISKERKNNRYKQILECDADYCAVRSCMYIIDEKYGRTDDRIFEIRILGFSIYYIFLKFQELGHENMHYMHDLYVSDHPPASIRFIYAFMSMTHIILAQIEEESAIKELNIIAEVGVYFDRMYFDADTFDLSLSALAYTERGMKHLEELHMGWNQLRNELESVAYVSLKTNDPVDFTEYVWVDKDGNMIL